MDYFAYSQRLDYLLEMIKKGRLSSPNQLAQRFECSERTIRRMIEHLKICGNRIEYCRTRRKYLVKSSD